MKKQMNIGSFHKELTSVKEGDAMLLVLKKLAQPKSARQLRGTNPSPLGSWVGWAY